MLRALFDPNKQRVKLVISFAQGIQIKRVQIVSHTLKYNGYSSFNADKNVFAWHPGKLSC